MPPRFLRNILLSAGLALPSGFAHAVPPLVTDDAEVAEKNVFEMYVGYDYESASGSITRQLPVAELNYGVLDRVEMSLEIPYLSAAGALGLGDIAFAVK